MKVHELKTWSEPFQAVADSRKKFEFRRDDRPGGFFTGDILRLREWLPCSGVRHNSPGRCPPGCTKGDYSGREIHARITYRLNAGEFGVPEGFAVLSLGYVHVVLSRDGCPCGIEEAVHA